MDRLLLGCGLHADAAFVDHNRSVRRFRRPLPRSVTQPRRGGTCSETALPASQAGAAAAKLCKVNPDAGNPMSGKMPAGALMTRTGLGNSSYLGPCPPPGEHPHRYLFGVFCVGRDKLGVTADTSPAVVGFNLHVNTLAKAEIMGLYKR
jgi:hypothetical protein